MEFKKEELRLVKNPKFKKPKNPWFKPQHFNKTTRKIRRGFRLP